MRLACNMEMKSRVHTHPGPWAPALCPYFTVQIFIYKCILPRHKRFTPYTHIRIHSHTHTHTIHSYAISGFAFAFAVKHSAAAVIRWYNLVRHTIYL